MTEPSTGLRASLHRRNGDFLLDAAFELPAHGVSALFGPSGAGKTTCLRAIAGFERNLDGQVAYLDTVWQDSARRQFMPAHRRGIGYVFQEASLFTHLSIAGNLDYGQRRAGRGSQVDRSRLLRLFGVDRLLGRKVVQLSGGERQRVAIVRALLANPKLLLLDEPLSALDAAARLELLGCLEQWHAELAIPTIYVSHAIDEIARLADYLVVMDAGRVVAQGPLQATLARGELPVAMRDLLGVVIEGRVVSHNVDDHLMELAFDSGRLWLPRRNERVGDRLRCRIGARDVVLSLRAPADSSVLNGIEAVVIGVMDAAHPSQCIVQLKAGATDLLASITQRSWRSLALAPGVAVWAQVKATALGVQT
ncbi:molybdenum ABC transporter ATP-binding protein [Rhodanobacter sp. Col0626]|uniref:molybdenum ABC transporter ATP-binding protein n=1 Tax=Rhodanobacter sp. Col0626 TaxID=3415679 RepID=UPI003CF06612